MEYRSVGRSGLKVSEIALGSWLTYGYGVDDDAARACVRKAYDLGVIFFDTADVYHQGAAEAFLGTELKAYRRRDLVLATKCYFPMSDNPNDCGLSRKHICESLHDSLQRLQTDYVDLLQCHRFDPHVPLEETVRAMDDLIRQGKMLYWGVSEWPAAQIRRAHDVARALGAAPPISNQPNYSIAGRWIEANGVQQACAELGMGILPFSPLAQGVLTGKYSGGKVPADSRVASAQMNMFLKSVDRDVADRVDRLRPIAERHGLTLAQLALRWLLQRDAVSSVIIGASRAEQVEMNCQLPEVVLSADDLAQVDALFPATA
jgi:voltage-dependent potassium channel beta subunit